MHGQLTRVAALAALALPAQVRIAKVLLDWYWDRRGPTVDSNCGARPLTGAEETRDPPSRPRTQAGPACRERRRLRLLHLVVAIAEGLQYGHRRRLVLLSEREAQQRR